MHKQPYDFHAYPTSFGQYGKSIIIWRAQSSITSRNGKFRIPAEGGSIQHLEILE